MPPLPIVFSSFSVLLAGLTLALAVSVAITDYKKKSHQLFVAMCGLLTAWHLCSAVRSITLLRFLEVIFLIPLPWVLSNFFHAWLPLNGENTQASKQPRSTFLQLGIFLMIISESLLIYAGLRHISLPQAIWPLRIYQTCYVICWTGIVFNFYPILWAYRTSPFVVEKKRLFVVLFLGVLSSIIAAIDHLPMPTGTNGPFLGAFLTVIYLYFLQQSLLLERILDSVEFFGRILVVCIFVAMLSTLYSLLIVLKLPPNQTLPWLVAFTLILYRPLHTFTDKILNKFWSRDKEPLTDALESIRQILASTLRLKEGVHHTAQILQRNWNPHRLAIYLLDQEGSGYELIESYGGQFPQSFDVITKRPLLAYLQQHQWTHLEKLSSHESDNGADKKEAKEFLKEIGATWAFGIFCRIKENYLTQETSTQRDNKLFGLLFVDSQSKDFSRSSEESFGLEVTSLLGVLIQNTKLYEQMKEKDRMAALGQMSAGLAHEIRNPLGAIKGAAELIKEQQLSDTPYANAHELVDILLEETQSLNQVVSLFLDYARPHKLIYQPIQLNELIKKIVSIAIGNWNKNNPPHQQIALVLNLSPNLPNSYGDGEQLKRVFLNLILNSLEAMDNQQDRRLRIETFFTSDKPQHIEVKITDNGVGISQEVMKNLFVPFYTTKAQGTGLGLAICQRIIENHKGTIHVKSRPYEETIFTMRLPVSTNLHIEESIFDNQDSK